MKLLMFTPAGHASAIARMARLVTKELIRQGCEVALVRTESPQQMESPGQEFGVDLLRWNDTGRVLAAAERCDAVIYQLGDNFEFHQGCMEWLPRLRGVVCLHDFFLGHLFWGWATAHGRGLAVEKLEDLYGAHIASEYFKASTSAEFVERTRLSSPMTEWVSAMASGVITHSGWGVSRVAAACAGPIEIVPLPYEAPVAFLGSGAPRELPRLKHVVLTIGHVNPNKRAESVIRAIGDSAILKAQMCYRIVGAVSPEMRRHLEAVAADQGAEVTICGEVDEQELAREIADADIMCCLRSPVLEAASASTIEAMLMGKPTMVSDHGFYAELPDCCVAKISPATEIEGIRDSLLALLSSADYRDALGSNAALFAKATFSADRYAGRLVKVVEAAATVSHPLRAMESFANTIRRWGGLRNSELVAPIISAQADFAGAGVCSPADNSCN